MRQFRSRLIHIFNCQGVTRQVIYKFLQYDPTLKKIYSLSSIKLSHLFSLRMNRAQLFYSDLRRFSLKNQIKKDATDFTIITIVDEHYPSMLKRIEDPPLVLYAIGDTSLLDHTPILSVIGTRNPTTNALAKINHLVKPLVKKDWLIVSGMAKGVDSYAHNVALNNSGPTIAILGGGFHHIYPRQNISLFNRIAKEGLVLSEYPPTMRPTRNHFPERNRIISGLSFGTLVIEAKERSGTLITVDQALDQGREVYAVPGSPLIEQTKGCNQMIQDGAKLALHADDLEEDWIQIGRNMFSL